MTADLERLYQGAKAALASRDYDRASSLLRQILVIDENYKDASRLLAQTVKLRRRRWYNDPVLWGALGLGVIVGLGVWLAPRLERVFDTQNIPPTDSPTLALTPTETQVPTETLTPIPIPIPLTWQRVSIGQEFERDTVTALVIDPKDPEVLYVGMEHAGIFKSIDGGLSWQPAHAGLANAHVTSLLIDLEDSQILYAGTMDGIYKTENGGETWLGTGEGNHILMDPQDSAHLYARDDESIYKSSDSGANWELAYSSQEDCPDQISSWAIHPANGETLFIGGGETCEEGIYQSNDGGRTWTFVEAWDLSAGGGNSNLVVNPKWFSIGLDSQGNVILQPSEMVAFDTAGFIYYDWNGSLRKDKIGEEQRMLLGKPDIGIFTNITISPFDPNTIYVGGEGLAVSRDGGMTWTKLNNGMGSGTLQLETGSGDMPILYLQSGECKRANDPEGRAFHDDAGQPLYISTNGGGIWDLSLQNGCYLVKDADDVILYRVGQEMAWSTDGSHLLGWLWLSRDQGNTWQTKYVMDVLVPFTVVAHPLQSGLLYAFLPNSFDFDHTDGTGGGEKKIISEDYGNNWKNTDAARDAKSCYGSTLQFIDAYRPMAIDPFDGNHVFVIDNGALLESHDSCDTTEPFATPPNTSMNSIAFDPNNSSIIYTGTDDGAYISFDSGETWRQVNDGLLGATVVYSIVVDKDGNVYAATPYGIFKLEGK